MELAQLLMDHGLQVMYFYNYQINLKYFILCNYYYHLNNRKKYV